jgi:3-hydroxyisobutyrate dehydrogenase-like beta-hydroxyacid dehydrogenase
MSSLVAKITKQTPIGFIGTGVMGRHMARHLLNAGYSLFVHNRTRSKADELVDAGATWCGSPKQVAEAASVVITMVGYPADVEQTLLGDVLPDWRHDGGLLIDMTTSEPKLAETIAKAAAAKNVASLDAPVSGGDKGAAAATLSIMVGGDEKAFEIARPLLDIMGSTIVHQGPAGSGQHCKMCNQIAVAATMVSVCESLAYAKASGLNPSTVLQSITGGAAGSWSLANLGPRMLAGDFEAGFYVKHFVKDLKIAVQSAQRMQLDLPGLALATELYRQLEEEGAADDGTQALFRRYS